MTRWVWLNAIVWLGVGLIGLTRIPFPFDGDQALFTVGAQQMSQGAVLYRDFWDLKQPGIYNFYEIAGRLFGFNEVGIHALEWLYMMALAIVLRLTLRRYTTPLGITFLPLLTIGVYYAACRSWHLTQVEGLVSFPLFLCLWFACCGAKSSRRSPLLFFLSGVMAGWVLLFKLVLLPVPLAFWLVTVPWRRSDLSVVLKAALPILSGVLLFILPTVIYLNHVGSLDLAYTTFFEVPQRILTEVPDGVIETEIGTSWRRLGNGLVWFMPWVSPLIALACFGLYFSPQSYRDRLTLMVLLWIIVGLFVIWLQRTSLWAYHYALVFVPCGILATKGLEICWEKLKGVDYSSLKAPAKHLILWLTTAFLLLPGFIPTVKDMLLLAIGNLGIPEAERFEYQKEVNPLYGALHAEADVLSQPGNLPGAIYVFGNPLIYFFSGRTQAIAINGWSLEYLLPEQWQQMVEQFTKALPPYIYVDQTREGIIAQQGKSVHQFMQERYRLHHQDAMGTWYVVNQ
jgi:hypothetical protein